MTVRVEVSPAVLAWAKVRARAEDEELLRKFPKLREWETGEVLPTIKQLEAFARATHTPIGFLFLSSPPQEQIPIADYRIMQDAILAKPSADLLDTIFHSQQRQEWYRSFAELNREDPVRFVGSVTTESSPVETAAFMREALGFDVGQRGSTFTDALSHLIEQAEARGVLVMVNGVVGNDTHRKLDPEEFRGFVLVDNLAPLIFVNGADTKSAQIFTLAHELAHLWIGETGLDDANLAERSNVDVERWCNQVAAEFLVSAAEIEHEFDSTRDLTEELERLARLLKVSTLVVLRRVFDAGKLEWTFYRAAYRQELDRVLTLISESTGGGNFYNTQPVRVSKRFTNAVIGSTLEGQTLYTEAFELLGVRKLSTFEELAGRLGVA